MKIVACIKRVPSTDTRVKVGADGSSIDTAQVEWIINPYDEFAVEAALRVKEAAGAGEVIVVSLGPAEAARELRTCLAMGADRALLLKDADASRRDALATASVLAAALRELAPDLVLCGKLAIDHDQGQVGLLLAHLLGMPCVTEIVKLSVAGGTATVERAGDGGTTERHEVALPAVLTCQKGLNEPRYANLKGIMAAKKKPLEERDAGPIAARLEVAGLELPPARAEGRIIGEGAAAVDELVRLLRDEAKVI
ncbi:MAG TPA: electron transfer flavoprotein subunit beta/FixA family protein [Planctomycetota bacterium]|nr:electron transfer flavoprotein subunit beta/FixA family protein [Planctomycetota bacterium]